MGTDAAVAPFERAARWTVTVDRSDQDVRAVPWRLWVTRLDHLAC